MTVQQTFEQMRSKQLDDNEAKYGQEIREKYGDDIVNEANEQFRKMNQQQYSQLEQLTLELNETLKLAFASSDPASPMAQQACELHKTWLLHYWSQYSVEAHQGLVQMYVDDERFTAYYDQIAPGLATFLRDAMLIYLKS